MFDPDSYYDAQPTTDLPQDYLPPPGPAPQRKRHTGAIVAIVLILLLFLFLVVIPLPTQFSRSISTVNALSAFTNDPSAYASVINITLGGVAVTGSFSVASGQPIAFYVMNSSGGQVFFVTADSGSFSFTASSGSYAFVAVSLLPDSVSITGTVSQPLVFGLLNDD